MVVRKGVLTGIAGLSVLLALGLYGLFDKYFVAAEQEALEVREQFCDAHASCFVTGVRGSFSRWRSSYQMRSRSAKVLVRHLADRQWGRVSVAQLAALGVDTVVVARLVGDGYLHPVLPTVYAVGHRAPSVEADLTAAVLYAGPGAMLSHATALWWRGLLDQPPRTIDVSTPRRCRSLRGIRVHGRRRCRRLWHRGLPTTTVEQALLDYAAVAPLERRVGSPGFLHPGCRRDRVDPADHGPGGAPGR